jgi:hypothetical protein
MSLGCIDSGGTIQTNGAIDSSTMYWGPTSDVPSLTNYTYIDEKNYNGYVHLQTNSESTSCSFYRSNDASNVQYPYTSLNGTEKQIYSTGSLSDYDGIGNTNELNSSAYTAAYACKQVSTLGTSKGDWYLPSCGELAYLPSIRFEVNKTITSLLSDYGNVGSLLITTSSYYWTSNEFNSNAVFGVAMSNGSVGNTRKNTNHRVRAFLRFNPTAGTIVR